MQIKIGVKLQVTDLGIFTVEDITVKESKLTGEWTTYIHLRNHQDYETMVLIGKNMKSYLADGSVSFVQ